MSLLKRDAVSLSDTSNALQVDGNLGDHYHFSDTGWVRKADVTLIDAAVAGCLFAGWC